MGLRVGMKVRVAMGLCFVVIVGVCWLVHSYEVPTELGPAGFPIHERDARATPPVETVAVVPTSGPGVGDVSSRFARPSVVEPQLGADQGGDTRLAVAPLPPPEAGSRTVVLPPLAAGLSGRELAATSEMPEMPAAPGRDAPDSALEVVLKIADDGTGLVPVRLADRGEAGSAGRRVAGDASPPPEAIIAGAAQDVVRRQVRRGDYLLKIARSEVRTTDPRVLKWIVDNNRQLRGRPDHLVVGTELVLPGPALVQRILRGEGADTFASAAEAAVGPDVLAVKTAGGAGVAPAPAGTKPKAAARPSAGGSKPADRPKEAVKPKSPPRAPPREPAGPSRHLASARDAAGRRGAERKAGETAKWQWYTIREKESLQEIAGRELKDRDRWRELAQLNGLKDPNRVQAGARIKVPATLVAARR